MDHSFLNGHPRFFGYITASAAPIGALGDLLAAAVNPNCGAWELAPIAGEIEAQAVRWIAELMGYPSSCGGLLVSGGNMANMVGFLAARRATAGGPEGRPRIGGGGASGRTPGLEGSGPRRLGGDRSSQVALCPDRGRLRAGARSGAPA